MLKISHKAVISAAAAVMLTACVDDDYDLSNLDTTVKVNVNELIIPVNIDEVLLSDILKLDQDDHVEIVDGKYAIVQDGEFTSGVVNVGAIDLKAPTLNPTYDNIILGGGAGSRAAGDYTYRIESSHSDFTMHADFVSDFIVSIAHIGCDLSLNTTVTLQGLDRYVRRVTFTDLEIQLPKGLDLVTGAGESYNATTGVLTIDKRVITGNVLELNFTATGVDFVKAGGKYLYDDSQIEVSGSMYIRSGLASISSADIIGGSSLPQSVSMMTSYVLSDAYVTSFSGELKYTISEADLTDVDLTNLPDVLTQETTNLKFANPCIYLQMNNPLQQYNLYAETGLKINAWRGEETESYPIDEDVFYIGRPARADGVYNFCLSPEMPATVDPDFAGAEHVGYRDLSYVLSGNGVPQTLEIELKSPMLPTQTVTDFRLGQDLGSLHGKYRFVAPMEFLDGSTIGYTNVMDGWWDEDMDKLTIQRLEVTALISTDIPVSLDFKGYPIDKEGKRIGNVEIVGAKVPANAKNVAVKIHITGEIRGLDGIEYVATANAQEGNALAPGMTISMKQIRPKVTGYYQDEL